MNRPDSKHCVFFVLLALLICGTRLTQAAVPGPQTSKIYLKLSDIAGSSTDDGHAGEIEVLSLNWSANHSGAKMEMHDALILKSIDMPRQS